jgi:hydroxyethylthiazole kinase
MSWGPDIVQTKGVDATHSVQEAEQSALVLAWELETIVAITGPTDVVTDGRRILRVQNGHPLMGRITGTGCAASALCAAFSAVEQDILYAAASALAFFGLAGERAGEKANAPGSFHIALLDALYLLTSEELTAQARIEEVYV